MLTKRNRFDVVEEILRHILLSNAYQARSLQDTIRLTLISMLSFVDILCLNHAHACRIYLACAIATKRYPVVIEQCRKLINAHQFKNEPQRILLAALASGLRPTDSFIASTLQKHLSREIRIADAAVKNKDSLRWNHLNKRYAPVAALKAGDGDDVVADDIEDDVQEERADDKAKLPDTPTKSNPINVAVYGQICIAAKSYQSAICPSIVL